MRTGWLTSVLLLAACAHQATPRKDEVKALVRQCGIEGKIEFKWLGGKQLTMTRLDEDTNWDKFMCVAHGLEARGMKLGFVGREPLTY